MGKMDGKVAIVTGGGGGIGSETSRLLAEEGARVVVADLAFERAVAVAEEIGDAASAVHFDQEDPESVRVLMDGVMESHGRIDLLHNNAALTDVEIFNRDKAITDTDIDVWDAAYRINLRGYVLGAKHVMPHMAANGGGAIVNMATDAGLAADTKHIAYGVTKSAVINLTQYIATHGGRQGIRCNSISPGAIFTETLRRNQSPESIEMLQRHQLTVGLGQPIDIARLVLFLGSEESKFITGQNVSCDGGLLAHLPHFGDVVSAPPSVGA